MKTHDLAVKVGTYEKDGETKNRYENIGCIVEGANGPYILLNRTFNPAGVPTDSERSNIIVSMFAKKSENKTSDVDY